MILESRFCSFTPVAGLQLCNSRGSAGSADCGRESISNRFRGDQPMREFYVLLLLFYVHEKIHSVFCIYVCVNSIIKVDVFEQTECPCQ